MATKEQERQAIKKIQAIIEGLGADSYIAAAMEGVLELAEDNIRDDAMYSWKQRTEAAQKELQAVNEQMKKTVIDLNTAKADMKDMQEELTERRKECLKLRMPQNDAEDLIEMVRISEKTATEQMEMAANAMARSIFNKSDNAEEYAQEYTEASIRQQKCKKLDKMLQKYMEV